MSIIESSLESGSADYPGSWYTRDDLRNANTKKHRY